MAYCLDEAVDMFGSTVESELNGMKRGKTESEKSFEAKKHNAFLRLMGQQPQFASPMATK